MQTLFSYFLLSVFYFNSIWAKTWLENEADMTKEGCPVAHPRLSNLPSASKMMEWPSWKVNLSTWALMLVLIMPGHFLSLSVSISLSKCPMLPTIALFFIFCIFSRVMIFKFPVAVTKMSILEITSSILTTSQPYMQAWRAQIGSHYEMKTLAPLPLMAWAHPFPTSPKPQTKTFLPEIMTSVALLIPSTSECLHPQTLSNLDLVTESLTLMQGHRSFFSVSQRQRRATPVVVSSEIPLRFLVNLEKQWASLVSNSLMMILNSYSSSDCSLDGSMSLPVSLNALSVASPSMQKTVASDPSSTIWSGPSPFSQVRQLTVNSQYSLRVSPFQAKTTPVLASATAAAAWS